MNQDGIHYSQIYLSKYEQYETHIIHNYMDYGRERPGVGRAVGLRNDVSSRGSLSLRRRGETMVGTPHKFGK